MRGRVAGVLALALLLSLPAAADAAFPGQNGKIAFVQGGDIRVMNPDGSGQVNVTNDAAAQGSPSWSPDGARIAFDEVDAGVIKTWTMKADGTDRVLADDGSVIASRRDPAYSPDGTRIAFTNGNTLFTMNPDGTQVTGVFGNANNDPDWSSDGGRIVYSDIGAVNADRPRLHAVDPNGANHQELTDDTSQNYIIEGSSWAPNAQRVAYFSFGDFCPPTCADAGFFTIKRDGTDRQTVPGGGPNPAYSPDGTRFAYDNRTSVLTMNADGTGVSGPLATGTEPDWQPILRGYARPKAATPMYAPLVPAQTPCSSPNRVHAAPLAYGSCNPPTQTSGFATVGTPDANGAPAKSVGSLRLVAIGEVPIDPGNGNQSDVVIGASITDVRNAGTLTDYTGGLRVKSALQITDRNNTPYPGGPGPGTVVPAAFEFNVPCATTADTTVGSTCSTSTTANAVLPGQVLERQRAIWELGRVEVHDGGTDGDPGTAGDNTLFATQGVFIP
jgi:WD40-like Beta Propeller Repeat